MIKCRDCKHEMSTRADFCPHCGLRRMRNRNDGFSLLIVIAVLFSCIGVALLYMTGNQKLLKDAWDQLNGRPVQQTTQAAQPPQQNSAANRELWQQRSLALVRDKIGLKDAQFANVYFNLANSGGVEIPVLCGEVVYPNGGHRQFIASAETNMVAMQGEQPDFPRIWGGLCATRSQTHAQ